MSSGKVDRISPMDAIVAGSLSGMASVAACHPFDVIRTRMQASGLPFKQAVKESAKNGLLSFYSGFGVPFMAQAVYKSVIFFVNTQVKQRLFPHRSDSWSTMCSGMIAGAANSLIVAPVEIVRTQQILTPSPSSQTPSISSVLQRIVQSNGFFSLWKGLGPAVLRDGPGVGFYLLCFDQVKAYLVKEHNVDRPTFWMRVLASSFAGVAFWTWAIPIDTIKTIIEASLQHRTEEGGSVLQMVREKVTWRNLYRGLPLAYARGIPSATVTLTTYDVCLQYLQESKTT